MSRKVIFTLRTSGEIVRLERDLPTFINVNDVARALSEQGFAIGQQYYPAHTIMGITWEFDNES